jgi:5-methylcytosine-specific restriction protein A
MSRVTELWHGKTDDSRAPPRVALRVFERFNGKCACCGRKIQPGEKWQLDHVEALINGGRNNESNLQPLLEEHHKNKSRADVAQKSSTYRKRSKHLGIKRTGRTIAGRKFDGTPIPSRIRI